MIYLDNNATTPLAPSVAEAISGALSLYGNPSSAHAIGRDAKQAVDEARFAIADLLGAEFSDEIAFTSSGTESDNWAILGALDTGKRHIVTTRVEHEAVRKVCEKLERSGYEITWLDVDEYGRLDLERLQDSLRRDTALVSVMLANNETGVIFPVADIAEIVKENSGALFHVDGVNAAGKVPIDLKNTRIDLLSVSAHKFHGPKGIGALYIRRGIALPPMIIGGGQEGGRRAGTEAVHQIVGFGAAARFASDLSSMEGIRQLRDELESSILKSVSAAWVNGDPSQRLPNTSNISFVGLNGEMILHRLDQAGVCVSTGSACHSSSNDSSPVLRAMNLPYARSLGSIRFSLGRFNRDDEIRIAIEEVKSAVSSLEPLRVEEIS